MKNTTLIVAGLLILIPAIVSAEESNVKVLLHSTDKYMAGWVVIPNLSKTISVAGPRYQHGDDWWVEMMAGAVVAEQEGIFLFDVRASYDKWDPIHFWANIEYFPSNGSWYSYLEMNYRLPAVGLIGLETENDHFQGREDDLTFGPRIVIPLSDMTLIGAYQFHEGGNRVWVRTVINF